MFTLNVGYISTDPEKLQDLEPMEHEQGEKQDNEALPEDAIDLEVQLMNAPFGDVHDEIIPNNPFLDIDDNNNESVNDFVLVQDIDSLPLISDLELSQILGTNDQLSRTL